LRRTFVKADSLTVHDNCTVCVWYFESRTTHGNKRFCAEVRLGPNDQIILDADSVTILEARVASIAPVSLYSRDLIMAHQL
jgi:hypothetical protein